MKEKEFLVKIKSGGYLPHQRNIMIWGPLIMLTQRRQWRPTPVLLPGKSHGQRSLVGCTPWGHEESDTTEWLHFHFSLSCIGEGNGNPLQCSCLENPRDREPGRLPSMGLHRVRYDWSNLAASWHIGDPLMLCPHMVFLLCTCRERERERKRALSHLFLF